MRIPISTLAVLLAATAAGCRPGINSEARAAASNAAPTVNATVAAVVEKPISRFVAATGTLTAEEQAEKLSQATRRADYVQCRAV